MVGPITVPIGLHMHVYLASVARLRRVTSTLVLVGNLWTKMSRLSLLGQHFKVTLLRCDLLEI